MNQSMTMAILAVAAVALLGVLMRRAGNGSGGVVTPPIPVPEAEEDADDSPGDASTAQVPISSEGVAFVSRTHGVLLLPLVGGDEAADWLDRALQSNYVPFSVLNQLYFSGAGGGVQPSRPGNPLGAADLTGVRVVRGAAGADPWRLETLGRDGDFGFHPFTSREAAEAALQLLVSRQVVRRPDDDQDPNPASPEDFEEARRRYEQTASDLAIDPDSEEPPREGQWVSDRR